ncbi:UDP-N-acetylmuramoylalanine--D-glutamate ligase [Erysipelothrix larvae]|uniref:UDP-N-acetylmuramoylalanine--D-glutamate ligase n=1 Tax=Erysipelothrix larvae TaxID=1514105 RepID=A0A0X8GZA8_9FIRM|nr:UDP-N-acetylmuramoyl-L-alanine--D-glutamate ligase [Erysipelothrix larvae]AMC93177.1 UDP-N-acetylmuramoylalanine--D-glutamate ligase [Erysipelothrix larvae]
MRALVIGAARSGVGAAHLLTQQGYHVTLVSNQDFNERDDLETMGVQVILDDSETDQFDQVDLVIKNPGIPNSHPLVSRFSHVINEIELASMYNPSGKLYGISGTNGKTTTVSLLYDMFKIHDSHAIVVGNIGIPYSEIVYQEGDVSRNVALELSSFQMENLPGLKLEAYALMNLTPDHLDRYESVEAYFSVKSRFGSQAKVVVRNADDAEVMKYTQSLEVPFINVSLESKQHVYLEKGWCFYGEDRLFPCDALQLAGKHNLMNAMFAAVMAYLGGVTSDQITQALSTFKGVEHRLELVQTLHGVRYFNDSKATNPESTEKALSAFDDHQVILLAGGYDKKIPFDILANYTSKLKAIYVFGDSALSIKSVFEEAIVVETMFEALQQAHKIATEGDVVLLSPACASFDQFKDYEDRGRQFKKMVHEL